MKLLFAGGAGIPALVTLTVIVGTQYSSPQGSEPTQPAAVVAEGDAEAGTCAEGEDCDAYVAGRDEDLSPGAALVSNADPAAILDLLTQQTSADAAGDTPVSAGFLCSSPFDCLDDLPGPGDLPLPTFAFTVGGNLKSVEGDQPGEPLELLGHGTDDAEFGSPGLSAGNAGHAGWMGETGGTGSGAGAGAFLNAGSSLPPGVGGSPGSPRAGGGSGSQGTFLHASTGGPSTGDAGPATETGDGGAPGDDPVTSSNTTVKLFVEDLLLGDGEGSDDQPGNGRGPAFDDVLDSFSGDEDDDEYADLTTPDDGRDTDLRPSEVPEPASMMMFGAGLVVTIAHLRRRRAKPVR